MSRACSHCILPSCPPSNQEGEDRVGTGKGRAGEELLAVSDCCRAGGMETAGLRPCLCSLHSGLLSLLPQTHTCWAEASLKVCLPLCFFAFGRPLLEILIFNLKGHLGIWELSSSIPRQVSASASSHYPAAFLPTVRDRGKWSHEDCAFCTCRHMAVPPHCQT
jgi:hypothetical protein